jgi:hypothetical protein
MIVILVSSSMIRTRSAPRWPPRAVEVIGPRNNNFFDPWGNRIEIVGYKGIQFSKTEGVLNGMGLGDLEKTDAAKRELADKGLG